MEELRSYNTGHDYVQERDGLRRFLFTFESEGVLKYMTQAKSLSSTRVFSLDVSDILEDGNTELYVSVIRNTGRYKEMVYEILDEMIKEEEIETPKEDLFFEHRKARVAERHPGKSVFDVLPRSLVRFYSVCIYKTECDGFGDVDSKRIGSLVTIRGVVSKMSAVHPSISVGVFMCDSCTSEVYQEVEGESFLPIVECRSEKCRMGRTKGTLHLQTRPSKFRSKQVLRLQELPGEIRPGRVPRSIDVEAYESLVQKAPAGTEVIVSGIFLPKTTEGIQKMKMGLLSDTYVLAAYIEPKKPKKSARKREAGTEESKENGERRAGEAGVKIGRVSAGGPLFPIDVLVGSIAPEIHGMKDVKKILLLMLIGGDTYSEGGMRIRGEINVLMVGEPGVAKSQLLKTMCKLSPRGVFTTGRGTSGAGLTACVSRDQETGEYHLEGGALVMSDGGVCCIDEFDKMHEGDRSCVYEAMEQHQISIAKAGINTTLNSRCSVLAAANPIKGKYVDKKSVSWNIGLPAALISRFDAVKVLRDISGKEDGEIARHVLGVHKRKGAVSGSLGPEELMRQIEIAKEIPTSLGVGVEERIVEAYTCERMRMSRDAEKDTPRTARRVLSVLRFSQALAKAHGREIVLVEDVEEVLRLLGGEAKGAYDAITQIPGEEFGEYRVVDMESVYREAGRFGYAEIERCIAEQIEAGAWSKEGSRLTIFGRRR